MSTQAVLIGVPAYKGDMKAACVMKLISLGETFRQKGITCGFNFPDINGIDNARNFLASLFLQNKTFNHLLFLDPDIVFDPMTAVRLLESKKDVIGAVCAKRELPPQYNVRALEDSAGGIQTVSEPGLHKVGAIGMGLTLISRNAFQHMIDTKKIRSASSHIYKDHGLRDSLYGLFDPIRSNDEEFSEDYSFCLRWRELCHGDVFALFGENTGHIGEYIYRA